MKSWYQSKTIIFSLALAASGAVQQFTPQLKAVLTADTYGYILFGAGIVSAVLRVITTQGLTK